MSSYNIFHWIKRFLLKGFEWASIRK
uniref:Uncharacterized protein n=1 Tax=Rhizophora mucronata TaxID=61149 RepID=A0A2P2NLB0_RHIMU